MQSGWRIGSLLDIPLFIDRSWPWIVGLIAFNDILLFTAAYGIPSAIGAGLTQALLLFGSVLCHELGHSLTARSQGIGVNSITLFFFGGVASIERESSSPWDALLVAIAGPAVSLVLYLLFSAFGVFFGALLPDGNIIQLLSTNLARISLVLALFNLIPGLPLDGGQVLKAAVWQITGDRIAGARWAINGGKFLGWSAIGIGLALVLLTGQIGAIWLTLIGSFILRNAKRYSQFTNLQALLLQLQAKDAMAPHVVLFPRYCNGSWVPSWVWSRPPWPWPTKLLC
jgi:Zn-dependent protease